MRGYKIFWKACLYGESVVEANSVEEAEAKALANKDTGFEQLDPEYDWEIELIEEMTNDISGNSRNPNLPRLPC